MCRKKVKVSSTPNGRKYRLAIISMLILLGGFGIAGLNLAFAAVYSQLVAAILGVNALYYGGNVSNKWVLGKKNDLPIGEGQVNSNSEVDPDGTIGK